MPEMDGNQLTNLLRSTQKMWQEKMRKSKIVNVKLKSIRSCPIIAATSFTDDQTVSDALKAGVELVLFKPVKLVNLKKVLQKFYVF